MMDKKVRLLELFGHIVDWGEEVASIVDGTDCEHFMQERLVRLSVWKCIENVGEAASRILKLYPDLADRHPELQLREARAMRNQLTHGYDGVDFELVWVTARRSVPSMVSAARRFLVPDGSYDIP